MQITLTKEQVKEAFGELRFMGADNCYRYDKDSKKKTEEVEALKLHLGMFFASTFWRKMQNIFGECCISKLEKVARPRLAAILPAT